MNKGAQVALGLGSNVGDSLSQLQKAVLEIPLRHKKCSWVYQSDALLPDGAPSAWNLPYLNLVVVGDTDLEPEALLKEVKALEIKMGRQDRGRWAPREIDIDILCWGSLIFRSQTLNIPHPDLLVRPFVLLPLAEVLPHWTYPLEGPYKNLSADKLAQKWNLSAANTEIPFGTKRWQSLL